MPTLFTKIVNGEIPCTKVWEDDEFLAFLDIMPVAPGHTLVIPKKESDYFFDLDDDAYARLMLASKKVAAAVKAATGCQRVCVGVFGFEVPHVHVHLIPLNSLSQFPFPAGRQKADPAALQAVAKQIQAKL